METIDLIKDGDKFIDKDGNIILRIIDGKCINILMVIIFYIKNINKNNITYNVWWLGGRFNAAKPLLSDGAVY